MSGSNTAHANHRCVPCATGVSCAPASSPATARPKMFHVDPVPTSRKVCGSSGFGSNVSVTPFSVGRNTAAPPTSRLASITIWSSTDTAPGVHTTTTASPPTTSATTGSPASTRNGYATASPLIVSPTTRSAKCRRSSGSPRNRRRTS